MRCGIQPFWFWNGEMDKAEICRQIGEMKEKGIQGFILHPRQGMELPYLSESYFDRVRLAVAEAKRLDMEVWLYDEYPYPSGVAAGQVMLDHPEYLCKMLDKTVLEAEGKGLVRLDLPWGKVVSAKAYPVRRGEAVWEEGIDLSSFIGTAYREEIFQFSGLTDYNHKRFFTGGQIRRLWWDAPEGSWKIYVFMEVVMTGFKYFNTYVDTMNPEAIRHFLKVTHERYQKELGEDWGKTVKGIYTDEVTAFPPERPWSPLLPKEVLKRTGIRLLDYLPVLFGESMGTEDGRIRYAYWNTAADLFMESYDRQVFLWCREHGVRLIGEKPVLRSREMEFFHCPGIDAGHQKAGAKPLLAPGKSRSNGKMASSGAFFYQKEAAVCEAFHSIGWGMTLQDMKWVMDWLFAHGIDWFVIHGFFYTANGLKKHDAPPSSFYQMPWWEGMGQLSRYAQRLRAVSKSCVRRVRILLVDPVTSFWTSDQEGQAALKSAFSTLQKELFWHQLDYYIIDPALLAEGKVEKDGLKTKMVIGGAGFDWIVLPPMKNLEDGCFNAVRRFAQAGGLVGAAGSLAKERIMELDVEPWMEEWFLGEHEGAFYGETERELCRKIKERAGGYRLEASLGLSREDILSAEFETAEGKRLYFIVNTSPKKGVLTGNIIRGRWEIGPFASGFYSLGADGFLELCQEKEGKEEELPLEESWQIEREGLNLLRLGRWKLESENTGQESAGPVEPMPIIDQLEKGRMLIPVTLKKQFGCPKTLLLAKDVYRYTAEFFLEGKAGHTPVYLAMEPGSIRGKWEICLNGHLVRPGDFAGKDLWFLDNQAAEVSGLLIQGRNRIQVRVWSKENFGGLVNPLYLAGDFGVRVREQACVLTDMPKAGRVRDREECGIPFYAGTVSYRLWKTLEKPGLGKSLKLVIRDASFQDYAELWVNGVHLGARSWAEYGWEVPDEAIRQGENQITLKVANTMSGLMEGQYFDQEAHCYKSYCGEETNIEAYEEVVGKESR